MSKYGYFDDAAKEYVVTNPVTPIKWCYYVDSLKLDGIVDGVDVDGVAKAYANDMPMDCLRINNV